MAEIGRGLQRGTAWLGAAALRDRESAELAYGGLATSDPERARWAGIWKLAPPGRPSLLVLAGDGRAWLRLRCDLGECELAPGSWTTEGGERARALVAHGGGPLGWDLALEAGADGAVSVAYGDPAEADPPRRVVAVRLDLAEHAGPLPVGARLDDEPAAGADPFHFVGAFSAVEVYDPRFVKWTEVWLWRDGSRLSGLTFREIAAPGSEQTIGSDRFADVRSSGDGTWSVRVRSRKVRLRLGPGVVDLEGDWGRNGERTLRLAPGAFLRDRRALLAPAEDARAWRTWMRDVVPGWGLRVRIPAAPATTW